MKYNLFLYISCGVFALFALGARIITIFKKQETSKEVELQKYDWSAN